MTISSTYNYLNETSSNLLNKRNTNTIDKSFKLQKEEKIEKVVIPKKIEGDYSTYTTEELKALSYNEIKKNYDEIKEILEERLNKAYLSGAAENYYKFRDSEFKKVDIPPEGISLEEISSFLKQYGPEKASEEIKEVDALLILQKQLKSIDYYDNEDINKAVFSRYQDLEEIEDANSFFYRGGTGLLGTKENKALDAFELIRISIKEAKEIIERDENILKNGLYYDEQTANIFRSEIKEMNIIQIGSKIFDINEVNVNIYKELDAEKEDKESDPSTKIEDIETTSKTSEIENEKPDYNTYTARQLRQLSFDEVKENYDELIKILENRLKKVNDLNKNEADDLLAFKAQLDKVDFLKDEQINENLFKKLQNINDSKVAVWSSLAINENIEDLKNGNVNSIVINKTAIFPDNIKINEEIKDNQEEDKNITDNQTIDKGQVNLDSIINTVLRTTLNANKTPQNAYTQEIINAYSNFISQYNELRGSLLS